MQVLARHFHLEHFPHTANAVEGGRAHWCLIQIGILILSFCIAQSIPFFSDFQNLVGALLAAPTMFGWPALFYWYGMRKNGEKISVFNWWVCWIFMGLVMPFCTVVGTVSATKSLINDWSTFGKPFDCVIKGYA